MSNLYPTDDADEPPSTKEQTMMLIEAIEHYADAASSEKIGLSRKEMLNIMRAIRDKARMALALCA